MTAADVAAELAALADPERAQHSQRFFKTGPGEYAEGDVFLGIAVPPQRKLARRFRDLPLDECELLLMSEIHEHRFVALAILIEHHRRGDAAERRAVEDLYLRRRDRVDNWDLVDASANHVLAGRLAEEPWLLDELACSESLWDRRIALLTTLTWIRAGRFDQTLRLAELMLDDPEPLIHKAAGWMLREVGNRDEGVLLAFLDNHAAVMPRTMLRYAIERLEPELRRHYMDAARAALADEPA